MGRGKNKPKELVCILHDEISDVADKILAMDWSEVYMDNTKEIIDYLNEQATKIKQYAKEAKERGIAMENRLRQYHDGISSLGFTRKRK